MRKGGGEGEGDEGVREVGLLEKDDGDGERAGNTTEEVEFSGGGGGQGEAVNVPGNFDFIQLRSKMPTGFV
jgi:hypothetical protein